MKKPKLSEIKAHYEGMVAKEEGVFYLLDLVKRMGEALEECSNSIELDEVDGWNKARELLKEISL